MGVIEANHNAAPGQCTRQRCQQQPAQIAAALQPGEDNTADGHRGGADKGGNKRVPRGILYGRSKKHGSQQQEEPYKDEDSDQNGADGKAADDRPARINGRRREQREAGGGDAVAIRWHGDSFKQRERQYRADGGSLPEAAVNCR